MSEKKTNISLEFLLLNDLLRTQAIDKAARKIVSAEKEKKAA